MLVCFMLLNVIVCSSIWCSYKIWCSGLTSIEHQNNGTAADRRSLPSKTWRRRWNLCSTLGTARHGRMSLCVFGRRWMPDIISADLGVNSRCQVSTYNIYCIVTYIYMVYEGLSAKQGWNMLENKAERCRKRMKVKLYLLRFSGAAMSGRNLEPSNNKPGQRMAKRHIGNT